MPPPQSHWYEHWIELPTLPEPTGAYDCASCFMLNPKGLTRDLGPFKADLKCCTFQPYLPAFTIGALIKFEKVPREVLNRFFFESRLTAVGAIPKRKATSVCETGKVASTACPFLSKDGFASCTIREFRPSTCAGYVCRSNRGPDGFRDWQQWEAEVAKFEWTLAHQVGFELGRTFDDIDHEFASFELARDYYLRAYEVAHEMTVEL